MLVNKLCIFFINFLFITVFADSIEEENDIGIYSIEGRVFPLSNYDKSQKNWQANTRVHVNGGEYLGFVKKDGSFIVQNIPSGSYIIEVLNPEFVFEPVRIEINSKGKLRARKVNHIQTASVVPVPYPLKFKALGRQRYFQQREQWRITDFLFNPMVLMMVVPLLLLMVLPKMLNDPETKKDMEQMQSLTKFELPEMSDMVTSFLSGGSSSNNQNNKKTQKVKKKQ